MNELNDIIKGFHLEMDDLHGIKDILAQQAELSCSDFVLSFLAHSLNSSLEKMYILAERLEYLLPSATAD